MSEKKILVTRSSMPPLEEYVDEIRELWESRWLTNMGKKHNLLKEELKKLWNVQNVDLLVNGHMALELVLQAMELKGEVITTPFTFASTTHAILRSGLTPVFCDVREDDYTLDAARIEELITEKTSAIMPVHVYGNICDVEAIEKIAEKYKLKVIYDAAHTFGESYKGKSVASYGDASCYSFHATKVFNTIEGGAVICRDKAVLDKIEILKDFGIVDAESVGAVGPNGKLNEFCAAMGLCNLRHHNSEIKKRKQVVLRYRQQLSHIEGITLNKECRDTISNYSYFPILVDENKYGMSRDELFDRLNAAGISARKYFYPLTNTFAVFEGKYDVHETPVAYRLSKQVMTLPLYADLEAGDIDRICDIIIKH